MKLTDTKINAVEFSSCKMIGIDWTMANWESLLSLEPLHFRDCLLGDSNFFGLTLNGVVMSECRITEADFRNAKLEKADFRGSDLKGTLFGNTHLEYANFTDASNTTIDLRTNHLKGAIFSQYEALQLLELMGIVLV
jgi:uncharacterized protein YjbI with pentapeptide repeats